MKISSLILPVSAMMSIFAVAADLPPEFVAAAQAARDAVPLGGDFQPRAEVPAVVAVGHGGRILLSRDDGQSWKQVYFGHLGSDHSPWATKAVAYTGGVFVVPVGWGAPVAWLASEDGVTWRHLTDGKTVLPVKGAREDSTVMAGTWGIAGGDGVFVSGGYMNMSATPDFGKSFTTFSLRSFRDDPRPRKLVTHHVGPVYCGDESGRFLALGNDRAKENAVFGNLYASDDRGKTWRWLEPQLLNQECEGYTGIETNGKRVVIIDKAGVNAFVSEDAGDSWQGPFATGAERSKLSLVGNEFWLVGRKRSRASSDGETWRDLPEGIPQGNVLATPNGALLNIDVRRTSILRSTDRGNSWQEVYAYEEPESEHIHGGQGLRDIAFGHINAQPVR